MLEKKQSPVFNMDELLFAIDVKPGRYSVGSVDRDFFSHINARCKMASERGLSKGYFRQIQNIANQD